MLKRLTTYSCAARFYAARSFPLMPRVDFQELAKTAVTSNLSSTHNSYITPKTSAKTLKV
jgi:hypothetical protein